MTDTEALDKAVQLWGERAWADRLSHLAHEPDTFEVGSSFCKIEGSGNSWEEAFAEAQR